VPDPLPLERKASELPLNVWAKQGRARQTASANPKDTKYAKCLIRPAALEKGLSEPRCNNARKGKKLY
jgi:hypothetical protein